MKRRLVLILSGLLLLSTPVLANASSGKGLNLDTSRLEKEAERTIGQQSDYLQGLFSQKSRDQLAAYQLAQEKQFETNQASLFTSQQSASTDIYQLDQLFLTQKQLVTETRVETFEAAEEVASSLGYLAVVVVSLLVASILTYRLSQRDWLEQVPSPDR